ncbi:MAG: hypothetical protein PHU75_03845 [Candidatus Nanopelagicales bacterium]|nr:hypothetical protein [Candidatus Nanopelagicales bacterium]
MSEKLSIPQFSAVLQRLRAEQMPVALRTLGRDVLLTVSKEAAENINGRVMKRTAPNADLARYSLAALRANIEYSGNTITAGLPEADLNARILGLRETGGDIKSKGKMLRIPLPPALTPAGRDRFAGIDLKSRIGTVGNPFFLMRSEAGNMLLARLIAKGAKGVLPVIEPWYLLRRAVTIGPHPSFANAVAATRERLEALATAAVARLERAR